MPTTKIFQVDDHAVLQPHEAIRRSLLAAGGEFVFFDCQNEREVIAHGAEAEIIWIVWRPLVSPAVMKALPRLRLLMRWGVGYEQIDVAAATAEGIAVANAPSYGTHDVAEHTLALLFGWERRIPWFAERMRVGEWPVASATPIHRLRGRTLGVVGLGRIGSAVVSRAQALGLRIVGHDPHRTDAELGALGVESCTLNALLARSDYVTLHVPFTSQSHHLMGAAALAAMRSTALLINTSRGRVVDQVALTDALRAGAIGGAALDVFEDEPLAVDSPLRSMANVLLTPHIAGYSLEALADMKQEMCDTVKDWVTLGWSNKVVNPEVRPSLRPRSAVIS